ncbi:MAG TPA: type II toxin-antitoxin system HicA family toxin [Thermoanaerobaculia bacterium]|jgi:predicted RNA binding protein YcfA (HicA-like mRNA interferase family)|nr:type II toxin-antitoxin system HicA family toxin [Thermoanaerobaculia bacterium]
MKRLSAVSRRDLLSRLKQLGFEGPYTGGRHEFLVRGSTRLTLPNPHRQDIGVDLLIRILRQAGVTREEWFATE